MIASFGNPRTIVTERLRELGVDAGIEFNVPPRPEMGDFSTPVALKLQKSWSRPGEAMKIAEELAAALTQLPLPYIRDVAVSRPGFLNFFLDNELYARDLLEQVSQQGDSYGMAPTPDTSSTPGAHRSKILIEHTNVNPNKAMHVGHVRNAVLGDTVVRTLRWAGFQVEACNYIDDTGVQVVDVVTALLYLEEPRYAGDGSFDPIWSKADPGVRFDHFCWDVYARVQEFLRPEPADIERFSPEQKELSTFVQARKQEVMHVLELADHPVGAFAKELATRIVHAHLLTVERLNVFYNLLNWESDILKAGFWQKTFDRLRAAGAIRYEEEGPNKGCWVVPRGGAEDEAEDSLSKVRILVRSNGAATYTAKDIAYQLWKFGRLDADFLYREWGIQANGEPLWSTSPDGEPRSGFGHASRVINVIDVRQSEPQRTVYASLDRLGFHEEAKNSEHLAYDIVKLSPRAAAELGVPVEAGQDVSMSGRKGLGVKADDLYERMEAVIRRAAENAKKPNPSLNAGALAAAAIRYYMLRFGTNTEIAFDFEIASQTSGDSGVYLVYAYARACSILARAKGNDEPRTEHEDSGAGGSEGFSIDLPAVIPNISRQEKSLLQEMGRLPEVLLQAAELLATTPLTTYAYSLASAFASFYDDSPSIVKEPDPEMRRYRLALVAAFRQVMRNTLEILGITALERV